MLAEHFVDDCCLDDPPTETAARGGRGEPEDVEIDEPFPIAGAQRFFVSRADVGDRIVAFAKRSDRVLQFDLLVGEPEIHRLGRLVTEEEAIGVAVQVLVEHVGGEVEGVASEMHRSIDSTG